MHSDSYFCVGATHNVCQDYALHGVTKKGKAFAIVSDGCSGSPNTDFGSRFMTKATQWALDNTEVNRELFTSATAMAQQMASSCNMEDTCLDATVLCAVEHEQDGRLGVLALAAGDGVIVARHRGCAYYDVHLIDFYDGYPAYPNYMSDVSRMQEYVKHTEGGLAGIRIKNGEDDKEEVVRHPFFYRVKNDGADFFSLETPWFRPYEVFFDREKYDLVMLLSDGVGSFQEMEASETSKRHAPLPLSKVLDEMTDFKNMKGEFVVRRSKRFLSKTCLDNRWVHHDDFSVAVIAMD